MGLSDTLISLEDTWHREESDFARNCSLSAVNGFCPVALSLAQNLEKERRGELLS